MSLNALTDDELVALFKSGNQNAFVETYERFWSVLFLHARSLLRENEEAADIVQELLTTTIWTKAASINLSHSLPSYFYKAVHNKVFDHLKHKKVMSGYLASFNEFIIEGQLTPDIIYSPMLDITTNTP